MRKNRLPEVSFVLRIWCEADVGPENAAEMRGRIEHAASGETVHFADFAEVEAFVCGWVKETPESAESRLPDRQWRLP